jgi:hypothetical protein
MIPLQQRTHSIHTCLRVLQSYLVERLHTEPGQAELKSCNNLVKQVTDTMHASSQPNLLTYGTPLASRAIHVR